MTRNEAIAIADEMKFAEDSHERHILLTWDEQLEGNKWCLVKLLQARMVEDGWVIEMAVFPGRFFATAKSLYGEFDSEAETEQSALVELFCKVYGIS